MSGREFLERNKIFFETIAAFLLSVMAVIVAYSQTGLLELQTRVAEVQVLPQFEMRTLVDNEGAASWVVENTGASIHDLESSAVCFFVARARTNVSTRKEVRLPVHDCIGSWFGPWGGKGEVLRVNGGRPTVREVRALSERFVQAASLQGWQDVGADIQVIVRLRYRDLLKRQHEDFYAAWSIEAGRLMEPAKGRDLFKRSEVMDARFLSFDLAPDKLVALVAKAPNGSVLRKQ